MTAQTAELYTVQPHALKIETFDNTHGGNAFFKAIGHPYVQTKVQDFITSISDQSGVALYDPYGMFNAFAEIHDVSSVRFHKTFVQRFEDLGATIHGASPQLIQDIDASKTRKLVIAAFDSDFLVRQMAHMIPQGVEVVSFDAFRLPETMLSNKRQYLSPLNFATNFALFRDTGQLHTRIATANYWSTYSGGKPITLWCCLLDEQGKQLHQWEQEFATPGGPVIIDSREVRKRFDLPEFSGQLFFQVIGAAGHDIVKYAMDIYSDDPKMLSCTHDANSWPADYYAGLPAPQEDEDVIFWIQNSHPCPIPASAIGLALMGDDKVAWYPEEIPPFGTVALNTRDLLPAATWPQQIEIYAGKYFVRPRYEVLSKNDHRRIAHVNVQRTDLQDDPGMQQLPQASYGKGFILPAPILDRTTWRSVLMPTPMSLAQQTLPLELRVYDAKGAEVLSKSLGSIKRSECPAIDLEDILPPVQDFSHGHVELLYDQHASGQRDGWLHGLFRYEHVETGHAAETSFGAHIFNTLTTYKSEPQSYRGRPPGLSTRLFLRLGDQDLDTICQLIYPASQTWCEKSSTFIELFDRDGDMFASEEINIPCGGSYFWRASDLFNQSSLDRAAYAIIRDPTCRLFGYHGLISEVGTFSLDHMFGF